MPDATLAEHVEWDRSEPGVSVSIKTMWKRLLARSDAQKNALVAAERVRADVADARPKDIVIADNLGSHKVAGVREAITARGAELILLPAYSPDQNPIEQVFAKLKALLRKTAPRSCETLWRSIGSIVSGFGRDECANYLRNCGYAQSG